MGLRVCQLCAVDFSLKHFLLPLIDGMQSHGWNVTAVCSDGPEIPGMRARGYKIDTIPISRSLNVFKHAISVVRLVAYFRRERFDILHVHTPVAALVARVAAFIARVPVVVYTAHGFYFHDEMPAWKRRLFVSLERFAGRFTDLLFTQSAEDAETAVQEGISPTAHTLAIGNGVDARRFDPAVIGDGRGMRQALGIPENAFVIGIIARQVVEKGILEFLEAAIAAAGMNPAIHILMVGERLASDHAGDVEAELEKANAALGKRLVATGARKDIPEVTCCHGRFLSAFVARGNAAYHHRSHDDGKGGRCHGYQGLTGRGCARRDRASGSDAVSLCFVRGISEAGRGSPNGRVDGVQGAHAGIGLV